MVVSTRPKLEAQNVPKPVPDDPKLGARVCSTAAPFGGTGPPNPGSSGGGR